MIFRGAPIRTFYTLSRTDEFYHHLDGKMRADLVVSKYLSASENLHCARNAENFLM